MVYIYMIEKLDMCLGTRAGEGELLAAPQVPGLGQGGRGHTHQSVVLELCP